MKIFHLIFEVSNLPHSLSRTSAYLSHPGYILDELKSPGLYYLSRRILLPPIFDGNSLPPLLCGWIKAAFTLTPQPALPTLIDPALFVLKER